MALMQDSNGTVLSAADTDDMTRRLLAGLADETDGVPLTRSAATALGCDALEVIIPLHRTP